MQLAWRKHTCFSLPWRSAADAATARTHTTAVNSRMNPEKATTTFMLGLLSTPVRVCAVVSGAGNTVKFKLASEMVCSRASWTGVAALLVSGGAVNSGQPGGGGGSFGRTCIPKNRHVETEKHC